MRRAGSRFAFAAVSFVRAPPFAKYSALHAGTVRDGRSQKEACFHSLSSFSPLYRDKYPEEQSLASAGCGYGSSPLRSLFHTQC